MHFSHCLFSRLGRGWNTCQTFHQDRFSSFLKGNQTFLVDSDIPCLHVARNNIVLLLITCDTYNRFLGLPVMPVNRFLKPIPNFYCLWLLTNYWSLPNGQEHCSTPDQIAMLTPPYVAPMDAVRQPHLTIKVTKCGLFSSLNFIRCYHDDCLSLWC